VDYAYATTVHKSQGSTFDTVFVDHRDLQACRGPEKRALLYVAVTRPERRLALLL
jgi:exodeoxyribonuclease-5